jgi:hypothetical protein
MWVCEKCKEELEDTFDCCWNCQTSRIVKRRKEKELSEDESIKLQQNLEGIRKVNLKIKKYLKLLDETDPQKFQLGFLIKEYLKSLEKLEPGIIYHLTEITFNLVEKNLTLNYLLKELENHKNIIEKRSETIPDSDINIGNNDERFSLNNIRISEVCDCCICNEERSHYTNEESEENIILEEIVMKFLLKNQ